MAEDESGEMTAFQTEVLNELTRIRMATDGVRSVLVWFAIMSVAVGVVVLGAILSAD